MVGEETREMVEGYLPRPAWLVAIHGGISPGTDLGNAIEHLVMFAKHMDGVEKQNLYVANVQKMEQCMLELYGYPNNTAPRAHKKSPKQDKQLQRLIKRFFLRSANGIQKQLKW